MSDDVSVIVCLRVGLAAAASVVAGSALDTCGRCGLDVFVAPSSQKVRALGPTELMCVLCAASEMLACESRGEPVTVEKIPGQAQEIARHTETRR